MTVIPASEIRQLREDISAVAPDCLTRFDLLQMRSWYIKALGLWEREVNVESMQPKVTDVANMPAATLAVVVFRAFVAVTLPTILFAMLAGLAAGVAVGIFRLTLSLF